MLPTLADAVIVAKCGLLLGVRDFAKVAAVFRGITLGNRSGSTAMGHKLLLIISTEICDKRHGDGEVVGGGRGKGGELPMTEIYEPSTGTWSTSGELIQSRKDHTATQFSDDKVIVIGGFSKGKASSLLETYDHSSGTWKSTPANTP